LASIFDLQRQRFGACSERLIRRHYLAARRRHISSATTPEPSAAHSHATSRVHLPYRKSTGTNAASFPHGQYTLRGHRHRHSRPGAFAIGHSCGDDVAFDFSWSFRGSGQHDADHVARIHAERLEIDLIWFGVLYLICMQLGLLVPPHELLLMTMKGVAPPQVTMAQSRFRNRR
jgi:hypothetical protein